MYNQLTREQRYAIYLGLKEGKSKKAIAQQINVSSSTVSREIKRNSNRHGRYIWKEAQELADVRKERLPGNRKMKQSVIDAALNLLRTEDWSPQQISGHLVQQGIRISHETIYRHIREDYTGELKSHCRHKMKYLRHIRKKRPTKATNIPDRTSIHDRPKEADGRRFGDWEMDLIIGNGQKSAVLTICERSSNFLLMTPLPHGKKPEEVAKAVVRLLCPYKDHVHTITTDNGSEFAHHKYIARKLGTTVYFADSYCSWQKGAIENANKLIRQYLPKGTDFRLYSESEIRQIQYKINRRPRRKLNFSSPKNVFFKLIS